MALKFLKNTTVSFPSESFQTMSFTVPSTLMPEITKTIARMIVSHYKPTTPQPVASKDWETADIPIFLAAIPDDAQTMIGHLHAYNNGLPGKPEGNGRGLSAESLAEVLGTAWTENKVNGMLSPIQRAASEMARGPVVFRNGIMLYLTQDFYKAISAFYKNTKR